MEYKTPAYVSGDIKRELIKKFEAERKVEMEKKR